jgi:hydrogenase maturation protein HypF
MEGSDALLRSKFSETEWKVYTQLLKNGTKLKSTSMGRLFDAVSSVLLGYNVHTFEAEASMQLENVASQYYYEHRMSLSDSYLEDKLPENIITFVLGEIMKEIKNGTDKGKIAAIFHITLADYILRVVGKFDSRKLAFSGGVFQNALMVDLIITFAGGEYDLYFQKEFSPNDEGIPFGQIMYYIVERNKRN